MTLPTWHNYATISKQLTTTKPLLCIDQQHSLTNGPIIVPQLTIFHNSHAKLSNCQNKPSWLGYNFSCHGHCFMGYFCPWAEPGLPHSSCRPCLSINEASVGPGDIYANNVTKMSPWRTAQTFTVKFMCSWVPQVSCGGHHRPRGKTTTGSALDGAVFDIAQILAYLAHNMSRSQLYLGFGHFGWLPSFFSQ